MTVFVTLESHLQAGKLDEFLRQMLADALPQTRAYSACISLQTLADRQSKAVLLVEEWASYEHQQAYMAWCMETGLLEALAPFVSGPPSQTTYETRPE